MTTDEPNEADFEHSLDEIETLVQGRHQTKIIELCDRLERSHPERFELYYHRAQARAINGDRAGALVDISTAISLQPTEPALFFFRGTWNLGDRRISEGVDDLTKVLELEHALGDSYYTESAKLARAVGWLHLGDFEASRRDCDGVRADMTGFVAGKLWKVADIRELATRRRSPG